MEHITSRKNRIVNHLKNLSADSDYRRNACEYVCDGEKTLKEALMFGAEVKSVLWGSQPYFEIPKGIEQYICPIELMQYVSPLKNSQGPVFSIRIPDYDDLSEKQITTAIVLENVQDPGNVGTVIRTANAMGIDVVILVGDCADLYNPKTIRATMGGIFRQCVIEMNIDELKYYVNQKELRLFGAALSDISIDIRNISMKKIAVAVGSEGRGLSSELLKICDGQLIIPMKPDSESLNAAVAASIIMWEMNRFD